MEVDPVPPTFLLESEGDEHFEQRTEQVEQIPFDNYVGVDNNGHVASETEPMEEPAVMNENAAENADLHEKSKINPCVVCRKVTKSKYNVERKNGKTSFLCSDECFAEFRANPSQFLKAAEQGGPTDVTNGVASIDKCAQCNKADTTVKLCWQSLMFCSEKCLEAYQTTNMSKECSYCAKEVDPNIRGRYSLIYQQMLRQFCSINCMDDYRLHNNVCVYCAREVIITEPLSDQLKVQSLSGGRTDVKMFCSTECYNSYNAESNKRNVTVESESGYRTRMSKGLLACAVCRKVCQPKVEYEFDSQKQRFCGEDCFYMFANENQIRAKCCGQCGTVAKKMSLSFIFNGRNHFFCSTPCLIGYRSSVSKMVQCEWCREECPNLSMVEQLDKDGVVRHLCSLQCLHMRESVKCEQCGKLSRAAYQLTIGTETKNFCSYVCVSSYQLKVATTGQEERKRTSYRPRTRQLSKAPDVEGTSTAESQMFTDVQVQMSDDPEPSSLGIGVSRCNRSIMTRPAQLCKAINCRPVMNDAESQTEEQWSRKNYVVPIPVPIYVPTPLSLTPAPTPFPCPMPIPVPIPIFVPVPLHTADRIANRVNLINERLKSNQFELDVLEMARAIRESVVFSESQLGPEQYIEPPTASVQTDPIEEPAPPQYQNHMPMVVHGMPNEMQESAQQAVAVDAGHQLQADQGNMYLAIEMPGNEIHEGNALELHTGDVQEGTILTTDQHGEYVSGSKRLRLTGGQGVPVQTSMAQDNQQVIWFQPDLGTTGLMQQPGETPMEVSISQQQQMMQTIQQQAPQMQQQQAQQSAIAQQQRPVTSPTTKIIPEDKFTLKFMYGVAAWNNWVQRKNASIQAQQQTQRGAKKLRLYTQNVLACSNEELNQALAQFAHEARRQAGEEYDPDSIYYLCLGIQIYLTENDRPENIFFDPQFADFQQSFNAVTAKYLPQLSPANELVCRIEEEHLWESKQLGPHSPFCLLNTLLYLNTKYFLLTTPEQHAKLSFTHITQQWRKTESGGKLKYLRYHNPIDKTGQYGYSRQLPLEQVENPQDSMRCPLKMYEFYLSKCPDAVQRRADAYYLVPESTSAADSPLWYSSKSVSMETLDALLSRIRMVREIQEALFLAGILTVEHLAPGRV